MTFKRNAQTNQADGAIYKNYFWCAAYHGEGFKTWYYVSADAPADVEEANYFLDAIDELEVGDRIVAYQVGAIDDTRSTQADVAAGLTTISEHIVLLNEGGTVNISPQLVNLSVEYTLP
jgi:hypothetical protein